MMLTSPLHKNEQSRVEKRVNSMEPTLTPSMPIDFFIVLLVSIFGNLLLFGIPTIKILRRTGRSGWWFLLFYTGIGTIVGLWLFAYCRWPALDRSQQ
jgi:hypothetical protein